MPNVLVVIVVAVLLMAETLNTRLISLSSNKDVATWLRHALGLSACDPNNTYYDQFAQRYGYLKYSETPNCKWVRFIFGDPEDD